MFDIFTLSLDLVSITPEHERRKMLPSNLCDIIFQVAIEPSIGKTNKDVQNRSIAILKNIDHSYARVIQEVEDIWTGLKLFETIVVPDGQSEISMDPSKSLKSLLPNLAYFPECFESFVTVLIKELASDAVQPPSLNILFDVLLGLLNSSVDSLRILTYFQLNLYLESIIRARQDQFCTERIFYEIVHNGMQHVDTQGHTCNILQKMFNSYGPKRLCTVAQCALPTLVAHVNLSENENFVLGFVWAILNLSRKEDLAIWLAIMVGNVNESIRILASRDLLSVLQKSEMQLHCNDFSDPLGFIKESSALPVPSRLIENESFRKRTFEKQELSDLIKVLSSANLFEKTRLSAGEQLLIAAKNQALMMILVDFNISDSIFSVISKEKNHEVLCICLKITSTLIKNSKYVRERCMQWHQLKILLGLLFNTSQDVRIQAMVSIRCL